MGILFITVRQESCIIKMEVLHAYRNVEFVKV